jgi:hypothetical protein
VISRLLAALAVSGCVATTSLPVIAAEAPLGGSATEPTPPSPDEPGTTSLDNPYLPERANVGDCVSALPHPECGSDARGGWRQTVVFVVLIGAITIVAVRLAAGVRKRSRQAG